MAMQLGQGRYPDAPLFSSACRSGCGNARASFASSAPRISPFLLLISAFRGHPSEISPKTVPILTKMIGFAGFRKNKYRFWTYSSLNRFFSRNKYHFWPYHDVAVSWIVKPKGRPSNENLRSGPRPTYRSAARTDALYQASLLDLCPGTRIEVRAAPTRYTHPSARCASTHDLDRIGKNRHSKQRHRSGLHVPVSERFLSIDN